MATHNVTPLPAANPDFYRPSRILQGTTITELETLVERTFLDARPLLSLAQIRILLHVWDACENCSGEGTISVRGYDSEFVEQERCPECRGKGYLVPAPTSAELMADALNAIPHPEVM